MGKFFGVEKNVYLLGVVSFLTDVSSEAIFSVFSIFFTLTLGASTALLGLIEGASDFASSSLDYLSGVTADRTGKNKLLTGLGYSFSALAKVILLISNTVLLASIFRVVERLGKSVRGPPRDAWISTLATKKNRGLSFGVHKALDKAGAIIGPLIAYAILSVLGSSLNAFKTVFAAALLPAVLAVVLLIFVKEKPVKKKPRENIFKSYKKFGSEYKHYLKTAGIFSIAYFSFGFLLLKAFLTGFSVKDVVLLYALFNATFVIFSPVLGRLGDKFGRKKIIYLEYMVYAMMSFGFMLVTTRLEIILMFAFFGIFYAIDEGQSKAYISDMEESRGSAIGLYNFVTGMVYLPASIIAGLLWAISPNYSFAFAALTAILALTFFRFKTPAGLKD